MSELPPCSAAQSISQLESQCFLYSTSPQLHTLHCTALHCTELHCTALHCAALHCTALFYTTLYYTTLYYTAVQCRPVFIVLNCIISTCSHWYATRHPLLFITQLHWLHYNTVNRLHFNTLYTFHCYSIILRYSTLNCTTLH